MLELAGRYFRYYAPATVKDTAYFFGVPQKQVKLWLDALPVSTILSEGKTYFYIDHNESGFDSVPDCLLLAGFDPLLLGYHKQESLFLPAEHIRGIFTLTGIVFPAILLRGRIVGRWKKDKGKLGLFLFERSSKKEKQLIAGCAEALWDDLKKVCFKDSALQ